MPLMERFKNVWENTDRRLLTTPAGAIAGMALVRALAPKKHRNWKSYTGGAVAGGAAGFGVGSIMENQRKDMVDTKTMSSPLTWMQQTPMAMTSFGPIIPTSSISDRPPAWSPSSLPRPRWGPTR